MDVVSVGDQVVPFFPTSTKYNGICTVMDSMYGRDEWEVKFDDGFRCSYCERKLCLAPQFKEINPQ